MLIEQTIKDLPKHLKTLTENAAAVGQNLVDRFWEGMGEINRRFAEVQKKTGDASTSKQAKSKSN